MPNPSTPTATAKAKAKKALTATLTRSPSTPMGTFGQLAIGDLQLQTAELPWHDNAHRISCIPPGTYTVLPRTSPKFGKHYQVQDVPDRDCILIHRGNFAGDHAAGFKSDVLGCILVGNGLAELDGQMAVVGSGVAMAQLLEVAPDGFSLVIE